MMGKKDIRLIGLDLDGTVLNDYKRVSERTKEAIRRAVAQGVHVVIATGRPVLGIPQDLLLSVPQIQYALTSNGALVIDLKSGEFLHHDCISVDRSIGLMTDLSRQDIMVEAYIDGMAYSSKKDLTNIKHFVLDQIMVNFFLKNRKPVDDIVEFVRERNKAVEKIHLMFPSKRLRRETWDRLNQMEDIIVTTANPNNLEINTVTANKGDSLVAFGKKLGIEREQIMACGDGNNDIRMLQAVGFSVAMGNACRELKELADYVTLTNNQDGVAAAIEKFVLH